MASEEDPANGEGEAPTAALKRWPGHELAAARERAGLDLASMAATLHLPQRQLEALERDDYQRLPAPTFVRGYLRAYAREVGLDGDDIVQAYDRLGPGAEEPALRVARPADAAHPPGRGVVLGLGVVIAVVVLGLAGWWWQSHGPGAGPQPFTTADSTGSGGSAGQDVDADGAAAGQPQGGAAGATADAANGEAVDTPEPTTAPSSERDAQARAAAERGGEPPAGESSAGESGESLQTAAAETATEGAAAGAADAGDGARTTAGAEGAAPAEAGASAESSEASGQAADEEPATVATADGATGQEPAAADEETAETAPGAENTAAAEYEPPDVTASAGEAVAPAGAEGPDTVVLRVDGRSWIEVYDARGRELVYTLYTGDAPLRINGWAPFDVFLGNSPDVEVVYAGRSVEKSAFTRSDQTARFLVDEQGARRR